jgi:cadmium resistance protein CadD (predicted permease)
MLVRNYKTGSWLGFCSIVLAAIPLSFILIPNVVPANDLIGFFGIGGSLVMAVGAGLIGSRLWFIALLGPALVIFLLLVSP